MFLDITRDSERLTTPEGDPLKQYLAIFKQVLFAIRELREEMIKPPSAHTPTKIKDIYRWFPYFQA
jgi:hypothetical protein